jgi:hypothetical protein
VERFVEFVELFEIHSIGSFALALKFCLKRAIVSGVPRRTALRCSTYGRSFEGYADKLRGFDLVQPKSLAITKENALEILKANGMQ